MSVLGFVLFQIASSNVSTVQYNLKETIILMLLSLTLCTNWSKTRSQIRSVLQICSNAKECERENKTKRYIVMVGYMFLNINAPRVCAWQKQKEQEVSGFRELVCVHQDFVLSWKTEDLLKITNCCFLVTIVSPSLIQRHNKLRCNVCK